MSFCLQPCSEVKLKVVEDVLVITPQDYKHRTFYENLFKEMTSKIKAIQPENGLWRTSLLSPVSFNHSETIDSRFLLAGSEILKLKK